MAAQSKLGFCASYVTGEEAKCVNTAEEIGADCCIFAFETK